MVLLKNPLSYPTMVELLPLSSLDLMTEGIIFMAFLRPYGLKN